MALSGEAEVGRVSDHAAAGAGIVLATLASAQFLMTLDSSVMNVSIATVAKDVGTTVTGIQTAITFYPLVMASLMITGGKLGQILGRKLAERRRAVRAPPDPRAGRLAAPAGTRGR